MMPTMKAAVVEVTAVSGWWGSSAEVLQVLLASASFTLYYHQYYNLLFGTLLQNSMPILSTFDRLAQKCQ